MSGVIFVGTNLGKCLGSIVASGILFFCLTTSVVLADPPKNYPFVSYNQGMQNAKRSGKYLFLYFGRLGCGYCDKVNRESFSDPKVRAAFTRNYELIYVDAESGNRLQLPSGERITEMELGTRLKVLGTPVFVFMSPEGKQIAKAPGFQTVKDLLFLDKFVSKGIYKKKTFAQYISETS